MEKSYIIPFSTISVVMKEATNAGVTDETSRVKPNYPQGPDSYILKDDLKYSPIDVDADGLGIMAIAEDGTVLGVLMESMDKPMQPHKVMVQGIVPMKIKSGTATITAGDRIMANKDITEFPHTIAKATQGKYSFGVALESGTQGDWIPVLIGTSNGFIPGGAI